MSLYANLSLFISGAINFNDGWTVYLLGEVKIIYKDHKILIVYMPLLTSYATTAKLR